MRKAWRYGRCGQLKWLACVTFDVFRQLRKVDDRIYGVMDVYASAIREARLQLFNNRIHMPCSFEGEGGIG